MRFHLSMQNDLQTLGTSCREMPIKRRAHDWASTTRLSHMLPLGLTTLPPGQESRRTSAALPPRCLRDRLEELYQLRRHLTSDVYCFEMLIFSDGAVRRCCARSQRSTGLGVPLRAWRAHRAQRDAKSSRGCQPHWTFQGQPDMR